MNKSLKSRRPQRGLWLSLTTFGLIGALVAAVPFHSARQAAFSEENSSVTRSHENGLENYDIRADKSAAEKLEFFRAAAGRNSNFLSAKQKETRAAEEALRQRVSSLAVEYNEDLGVPEVIAPDVKQGFAVLSSATSSKNSETLRNFVKQNNSLLGLTDAQADELEVVADYANPNGNLYFAQLEQKINGIPVFRGEVKAGFNKRGEMFRVINNLAPGLDYNSLSTEFGDPAEAVKNAYINLGHEFKAEDLQVNAAESTDLKVKFGTGDWATTAEKFYFPTETGVARASWRVYVVEPIFAYYVIVDGETGTPLHRKNLTAHQTQSATYNVYANPNAMIPVHDSPNPFTPGPESPTLEAQGPRVNRTDVTRVGNEEPYTFNNLGWIADTPEGTNAVTDGNAVEAGIDRDGTNGVDPQGKATANGRQFIFNYNPFNPVDNTGDAPNPVPQTYPITEYQNGAVTQLFYLSNWYHDEMYRLGWTEQAFNFQTNNFGRGGAGNDRLSAEAQDSSGTNNANMLTPADGTRPRMQMYLWTGPTPDLDGTIDNEVSTHEFTHGLSNRLHGNSSGLTSNMSRGMGEGWSDFYGHAMLSEPTDPINGIYTTGGYATYLAATNFRSNYYHGIRRFPGAPIAFTGPNGKPHNPLSFRHLNSNCNTEIGTPSTIGTISAFPRGPFGSSTCDAVHNAGEIWKAPLIEFRARFIQRLGWEVGNRRTLQYVTDGMKLAPLNPTLLQERDAIIAAAQASGSGEDVDDIWRGFALRGMGFSARVISASPANVTEAFDLPNAVIANGFAVADPAPGGDGDGYPEPGETVQLTVPVVNNTGATLTGVTVNVTNGGSADYGNINNGETVTRVISYTVPADAACGSLHTVTLNLTSNVGTRSETRTFRLGAPEGGAPVTASNTTAITINDNAPAAPYPSSIEVTGVPANSQVNIKVNLNGLTHTYPSDVDVLLVGPAGQKMIVMSDVGGGNDVTNINLTLNDLAQNLLPTTGTIAAGEYKPTNSGATDAFAAPAPTGPYQSPAPGGTATLASVFGTTGSAMNGTWSLYIVDDVGTDLGSVANGWSLTFESTSYICNNTVAPTNARADYDGDGRTDISVFRNGEFYIQRSSQGFEALTWGAAGDTVLSGDFNGDNKADYVVYRPTSTEGEADAYVLFNGSTQFTTLSLGDPGDRPFVSDFNGDNLDDLAVYRASNNTWFILPTGGGAPTTESLGDTAGQTPFVLYYDNDAQADLAMWNSETGIWTIRKSTGGFENVQWGATGDRLVTADYDNDNRDDLAIYRDGQWWIRRSSDGQTEVINFGAASDVPVPGDYDGDGDDDLAVFRDGVWFVRTATGGFNATQFGLGSDKPIPSVFVQ